MFKPSHILLANLHMQRPLKRVKRHLYLVVTGLASRDPRIAEQLTVLAESPDVPENGLCVRGDLDASLKEKVKEALLNMDRDDEGREVLAKFGARRFLVTTDEDYAVVFRFAEKVGLDLASYDYRNQ